MGLDCFSDPSDEQKLEMSRITNVSVQQISHWYVLAFNIFTLCFCHISYERFKKI